MLDRRSGAPPELCWFRTRWQADDCYGPHSGRAALLKAFEGVDRVTARRAATPAIG